MVSNAKEIVLPDDGREGFSFSRFLKRYSAAFLLVAAFICAFFIADRRSMIMVTDGWEQHVRALGYFGRWLRAIVRNLHDTGSFELPMYGVSLGYGSDVIGTLHYYVLGDPLNLLAGLVPAAFTPLLYAVLIQLRLYLAGLAFAGFVSYALPQARTQPVTIAALAYVFFGYAILFSVMHPYFMNPLIYFPLILWGVERVMRERKPGLFTAAFFVASASSFYFLYMLVVLTVPYILWRLVTTYRRDARQLLAQGVRLLVAGLLGALMAAAILLPAVIAFLGCSRSSSGNVFDPLYGLTYYYQMLVGLSNAQVGLTSWASIGLNPLVVIAMVAALVMPGRTGVKVATVAVFAGACLPAFGSFVNGLSYPVHRWYWAIALVGSYALVDVWDDLPSLSVPRRVVLVLFACAFGYGTWHVLELTGWDYVGTWVMLGLTMACSALAIFWVEGLPPRVSHAFELMLGCAALVAILADVFVVYSGRFGNYTEQFKTFDDAASFYKTDAAAIGERDSMDDLYRIAGDALSINGSALGDVSSTQYYWSIASAAADDYYRELGNNVSLSQRVSGLDDRTILEELACVRYYVANSEWTVPYGFELAPEFDDAIGLGESEHVYRNTLALPLGYSYDRTISRADYEALGMVDRQWALLQGAVLEDGSSAALASTTPSTTSKTLDITVEAGEGARVEGSALVAEQGGAQVTITFAGLPKSETYLCLEGLVFEPNNASSSQIYPWVRFARGDQQQRGVTLVYRTERHRWYENRHDFAICSGYSEEPLTSLTLSLPAAGTYRFDSLSVVSQPMEGYEAYVQRLREHSLQNIDMHYLGAIKATNRITGEIDLTQDEVLVIALPFGNGWTATVDGKPQDLLRANTMFFGLELGAGYHDIELSYRTPGLTWGLRMSAAGWILCLLWFVARRIKTSRSQTQDPEGEPERQVHI